MSTPTLPSTAGLITDPTARKVIGNVFAWGSLLLTATALVNGFVPLPVVGPDLPIAFGIWGGFFGLFQLTSTSPNVPTPAAIVKATGTTPAPGTVTVGPNV